MEYSIINKRVISTKISNTPKILPNNLKFIMDRFSLTDSQLADLLGVKVSYVSLIKNNKANLSGKNTLKLMQELNIPFNLIYNVNRKEEVFYETITDKICIVESMNELNIESTELMISIAKRLAKVESIDNEKDVLILKYNSKINLESNQQLDFSNDEKNLTVNLKRDYQEVSKECSQCLSKDKFYYLVGYEVKNQPNGEKQFINIQENLNPELLNYLFNSPFISQKEIIVDDIDKIIKDDVLYLDKEYDVYIEGKFVKTDKVHIDNIEVTKVQRGWCVLVNIYSFVKLKALRDKVGLYMDEMAEILNIEPASYKLMEQGHQNFGTHIMWIIEKKFGITIDSILDIDRYYKKFY